MRLKCLLMEAAMTTLSFLVIGCATSEQNATKTAAIGFITTPASYYSSAKARYLGTKYKENLDRLAERIVRNPKTAGLQFANNIASVGGIGFFTHSAASTADERFLEVVLSAPKTFEGQGEVNNKLASVFSTYGRELLSILAGDSDIYQEKEVSGYGLNLTWRSIVPDAKGTRVVLERAVIYVSKDKVRPYLHQDVDQKTFLADATIFTASDNAPMSLVSYRQQGPRLDTRAPIHEESLVGRRPRTETESRPPSQPQPEAVAAAPSSLPGASGSRQGPVIVSNAIETTNEDSVATQRGRDSSGDRLPEPTKRSAHEAAVKKPVAEPGLPLSKSPGRSSAVPGTGKIAENGSVTRRTAESSEVKKAEAPVSTSPIQNMDRDGEGKSVSNLTSSASVSKPLAKQTGGGRGEAADATSVRDEVTSVAATKRDIAILAKSEVKARAVPAVSTTPSVEGGPQSTADKTASERVALQKNKTTEIMTKTKSAIGPRSKALEGYIIQLAFRDKTDARRWAESMEQRGYAVSVTEAGGAEAVRVRVGNFLFREEADRQLTALKQQGLAGIVINLPQAYRPDAHASSTDGSEKQPAQLLQ